jgi:hypothetical protein
MQHGVVSIHAREVTLNARGADIDPDPVHVPAALPF